MCTCSYLLEKYIAYIQYISEPAETYSCNWQGNLFLSGAVFFFLGQISCIWGPVMPVTRYSVTGYCNLTTFLQ